MMVHRCLEKGGALPAHVAAQTCVVFAAGEWIADEAIQALVDQADVVLACDGALTKCLQRGIRPHAVIGDMDSVEQDLLDGFKANGGLVVHETGQDTNDLAKTLNWVEEQGFAKCSIVGATGGDPQHEWANLMTCADSKLDITCESLHHVYRFIKSGMNNSIEIGKGAYFSLFAIPEAHEVHLTGAKFELKGSSMKLGSQGVHNIATSSVVNISFMHGRLMAIYPHPGWMEEGKNGA